MSDPFPGSGCFVSIDRSPPSSSLAQTGSAARTKLSLPSVHISLPENVVCRIRWAYLDQLLIRKKGHPAAVAILYSEVMRRLLSEGAVDFAVSMDTRGFSAPPRAVVLPGITRRMLMPGTTGSAAASRVVAPSGEGCSDGLHPDPEESMGGTGGVARPLAALNTCTSDALAELLRHLKRSYWPLPWDSSISSVPPGSSADELMSHGGFRPAAKAACGDQMSAQLSAVSRVANHRLERGIWTSPGGGRGWGQNINSLEHGCLFDELRPMSWVN